MAARLTPVDLDDLELLSGADRTYSHGAGVDPVVDRASVHYYQRSGHSFVAKGDGGVLGFVLAHASWSGGRPVVRIERLVARAAHATARDAGATATALVEAVVKSAYDSGVYDILAAVPASDALADAALARAAFGKQSVTVYTRVLGSRAAAAHQGG